MDARALMHAVLDGEATPEEARELERLLAGDAAARAEYESLKVFFAKVQGVPPIDPPAGLADSIAERVKLRNSDRKRETAMDQKKSKRALWIAVALAAGV